MTSTEGMIPWLHFVARGDCSHAKHFKDRLSTADNPDNPFCFYGSELIGFIEMFETQKVVLTSSSNQGTEIR